MAAHYRPTGRSTIGPVFNIGASAAGAHLPGICRVGRRCTFAGYLPGRPGEPINGRPPGHHLHLPPAPAYPAKRAEPFAARLHPPQNQSGGRGSLPLRRPGGPHRAQAGPHRGSTDAHTTGPQVPTVLGPRRAPSPPAGPTIAAGLPPTGAVAAGAYPGT